MWQTKSYETKCNLCSHRVRPRYQQPQIIYYIYYIIFACICQYIILENFILISSLSLLSIFYHNSSRLSIGFLKNFSVFSNFFRAAGYLNTMVRFLTNLATELAPANYCRIMRPFMENLQRIRRARNCTGDGAAYL